MGTWGTGLYSCDIAEDVKLACNDVFAFYDVKKGNEIILNTFKDVVNQECDDNEAASFWYALADWQWKHGILTEEIRTKALMLLENYTGIKEWETFGNTRDVKQRRVVLDKLSRQLLLRQPDVKLPKATLAKPKHKCGDIIIFKTSCRDEDRYGNLWCFENFSPPFLFENKLITSSKYENITKISKHNCYMSILCVGSIKYPHSEYVRDKTDEHSLYVWYDFCSNDKPTVEKLQKCGFLPFIATEYIDFNRNEYSLVDWAYKFTVESETFKIKNDSAISMVNRFSCVEEVERFNSLFSLKNYSCDFAMFAELYSAFYTVWQEKERLKSIGMFVDNLLDEKEINPKLKSPKDSTKAYSRWAKTI